MKKLVQSPEIMAQIRLEPENVPCLESAEGIFKEIKDQLTKAGIPAIFDKDTKKLKLLGYIDQGLFDVLLRSIKNTSFRDSKGLFSAYVSKINALSNRR